MPAYKVDGIISILGLIAVAGLYMKMSHYPKEVQIMPGALLIIGGILFLVLGCWSLISKSKTEKTFEDFPAMKILAVILLLFLYFVLIQNLGFYITSWIFFMLVATWLGKGKNKFFSWIIGTFFILFLYLIFEMFLRVPLPN